MIANATSEITKTLADLRTALCAAGLNVVADAVSGATSLAHLRTALYSCGDIPLVGRSAWLRRACAGLGAAVEAIERASAEVERTRAALEAYHRESVSCPGCGARGACDETCPLRIGGAV